ncbi:hypothetical protein AB4156_41830, partial [Cupriavidus sp. 2MCAB6]|uniref:hypothetical protein n=1 Tax=Cupriavidus sp. 2MCAB6 TaxID=3232981 RepID=UPI003F8E653E
RLRERHDTFAQFARRVPWLERVFVEYDTFRLAAPHRTRAQSLGHVARMAARALRRRLRIRLKRTPALASMTHGVAGVFTDNWFAPEVQMSPSPSRARKLVIEGIAPKPMHVRIESNGRLLVEQAIAAGAVTKLAFQGTDGPIRLLFDDFVVDDHRRRLSFCVRYTNCFAEHEI